MSRILSIIILICISPVLLIVSVIILIDDGLPIMFKQKRVGQYNDHFFIYKFRTMKRNTPDIPTHLANYGQSIFTNVGPFLRKYSLDELTQLINIVKGDMQFIGPRPALHNQSDLIELRSKVGVHKLIPGVTGWAQVNGRDALSIPKKVKMDEFYLKNQSLLLDLKILIMTIKKVFKAENVLDK